MNRVPVSLNINPTSIVHGVTDNFDRDENTSSGIGGGHDTILMLFQNVRNQLTTMSYFQTREP